MKFWNAMDGTLTLELTCADPERILDHLSREDIHIRNVVMKSELTMVLRVMRRDLPRVQTFCTRRGVTVRICGRSGLFYAVRPIGRRPLVLVTLFTLLAFTLFIPRRVFFLEVSGNQSVSTNRILEAAEQCGLSFGTPRRAVRSERIKNHLLARIPELQWAGVNTSGCTAVISVREKTREEDTSEPLPVSSIVASHDGVILELVAQSGTPICRVGQAVRKGQTLISGYTDCGLFIQATAAKGEVYAHTSRQLHMVSPVSVSEKVSAGPQQRFLTLLIGKKRIKLWKDSGIWDTTCGRMYTEYYVQLPGGFRLPVGLAVDTVTPYDFRAMEIPQSLLRDALSAYGRAYLTEHLVAGEILESILTAEYEPGLFHLRSEYSCREMIGTVQPEKIGEHYGKTD